MSRGPASAYSTFLWPPHRLRSVGRSRAPRLAKTICSSELPEPGRREPLPLLVAYRLRVDSVADLLAAYDDQVRAAEVNDLAPGVYAEADGPIVRIVGQHRGFRASSGSDPARTG